MLDYDLEKAVNDNNHEEIDKYLDNYNFLKNRNIKKNNQNIIQTVSQEGYKSVLLAIINYLKRKSDNFIEILNLTDDFKWNALFSTIDFSENGLPEIVEILVRNGIDINYKDDKGISALHLAAYKGQDDNVEYLIKQKANIDSKDILGRTPIFFAIMEGQTNAIQALLDSGADINVIDNNGDSLLHYSYYSKGNCLLYIIMLQEKGLSIDISNNNGDSILLLCAKDGIRNNIRIISKIIELGASKTVKNKDNECFNSLAYEQILKDINFTNNYYNQENEQKFLKINSSNHNNNNNLVILRKNMFKLSAIFLVFSILMKIFKY